MYDVPVDSIRKASGLLFYIFGACAIALVLLARRGNLSPAMRPLLDIVDLPLLFVAFLYGGSSLYASLTKGKKSLPLLMGIFIPLGVLFVVLAWFNFGLPFPAV